MPRAFASVSLPWCHAEYEDSIDAASPIGDFESVFEDMPIPTDVNVVPFVTFPSLLRRRSSNTAAPGSHIIQPSTTTSPSGSLQYIQCASHLMAGGGACAVCASLPLRFGVERPH